MTSPLFSLFPRRSAAAWRRSSWRDGIFILEHFDPSGDIEINADAAGLFGASIAERVSEVRTRLFFCSSCMRSCLFGSPFLFFRLLFLVLYLRPVYLELPLQSGCQRYAARLLFVFSGGTP